MSGKKKTTANANTNLQTIKIGSRVRCTDDGVEGRIVWANATAVKIRWDDGEQVTWRRDSLADRPIEILAESNGENLPEAHAAREAIAPTEQTEEAQTDTQAAPTTATPAPPEQSAAEPPTEPVALESPVVEQPVEVPCTESTEELLATTVEQMPAAGTHPEAGPQSVIAQETHTSPEQAAEQPDAPSATTKQPRVRKPKDTTGGQEKRLSALDAAAKVLEETGQAMNCQEMIATMAAKGYWTSPGGKTPAATLYSALLREISTKGEASRFQKTARGQFAGKTGV